MTESRFFKGIKQKKVTYKGLKAKNPLFIEDMHMMGGFFIANYKKVKAQLPKGYKPVKIFPNKTLIGIHCMEYRKTDIGPYDEVSISVVLQPPGWLLPATIKNALSLLSHNYHAFVQELPVSTKEAKIQGEHFLKFPKFVGDISFRETKTHRICTLRDKKSRKLILELDFLKLKTTHISQDKKLDTVTIHTYSPDKDPNYRGKCKVNLLERGRSYLIPHIALRLGKHDLSENLKGLNLGIALQSDLVPHCEAVLYPVPK